MNFEIELLIGDFFELRGLSFTILYLVYIGSEFEIVRIV